MIITEKLTTPSKPGKKPIQVWEVTNMAEFEKQLLLSIGGRRWKGAVSFFNDPTDEISELKESGLWNPENALLSRTDWLSSKVEKRESWAESRESKSNEAYERSDRLSEPFKNGQPILVGHHSEKGARALQRKMHAAMDKCLEHSKMAKHHEYVAETHSYTIKKLNNSPRYYANKLKKHKHRVNQLKAYQEGRFYIRKSAYQGDCKKPSEETIAVYQAQIDSIMIDIEFCEKKIKELTKVAA